jgi:DNA adenine methylase
MRNVTLLKERASELGRPLSAKSPLRYPGGKTRAVEAITHYFPKGLEQMVSPFFGGGSVELFMAAKGVQVLGFDLFQPLVDFWQCLLAEPLKLAAAVQVLHPLSRDAFYRLQRESMCFSDKLQRAAGYYVLNRSSFSGSTLSGGMSPNHPRYTPSSIERIRTFHNPNVTVQRSDFSGPLLEFQDVFTYLDPPYLIRNNLYGKNGDAHKNFDHAGLAAILKKREHWILSYNDCNEIRALYSGHRVETPEWKYGMALDKTSREVLIFSRNLR